MPKWEIDRYNEPNIELAITQTHSGIKFVMSRVSEKISAEFNGDVADEVFALVALIGKRLDEEKRIERRRQRA